MYYLLNDISTFVTLNHNQNCKKSLELLSVDFKLFTVAAKKKLTGEFTDRPQGTTPW